MLALSSPEDPVGHRRCKLIARAATAIDVGTIRRDLHHGTTIAQCVERSSELRITVQSEDGEVVEILDGLRDGPAEVVVVETQLRVRGRDRHAIELEEGIEGAGQHVALQFEDVELAQVGQAGRQFAVQLVGVQTESLEVAQEAHFGRDFARQTIVACGGRVDRGKDGSVQVQVEMECCMGMGMAGSALGIALERGEKEANCHSDHHHHHHHRHCHRCRRRRLLSVCLRTDQVNNQLAE
mmetsp:Transcript_12522/g.34514  ORF Transcript_12522/g.34514 Transcript_12522/m.34514 type:complete len:239 (-) Transcript_12522:76-792(-)